MAVTEFADGCVAPRTGRYGAIYQPSKPVGVNSAAVGLSVDVGPPLEEAPPSLLCEEGFTRRSDVSVVLPEIASWFGARRGRSGNSNVVKRQGADSGSWMSWRSPDFP